MSSVIWDLASYPVWTLLIWIHREVYIGASHSSSIWENHRSPWISLNCSTCDPIMIHFISRCTNATQSATDWWLTTDENSGYRSLVNVLERDLDNSHIWAWHPQLKYTADPLWWMYIRYSILSATDVRCLHHMPIILLSNIRVSSSHCFIIDCDVSSTFMFAMSVELSSSKL